MDFLKALFGLQEPNNQEDDKSGELTAAFKELRKSIAGTGNPEYPFNSKEYKYAPESRMPCTDFTGFIIERLRANDRKSICLLMTEIIRANPGIGAGPEWVCRDIERVLETPFEEYVDFDDEEAYYELKALWIMASKDGGNAEFWIAAPRGYPEVFARALSCYQISWGPKMGQLISAANTFIKRSSDPERWGPTIWDDYSHFSPESILVVSLGMNDVRRIMRNLSIGARLHLLDIVEKAGGILPKRARYQTKEFGLDVTQSSKELLQGDLLALSFTDLSLKNSLTKKELIEECEIAGVNYRKSWNKTQLMKALSTGNPSRVKELITRMQIVSAKPQYADSLSTILTYSAALVDPFKILSFAR